MCEENREVLESVSKEYLVLIEESGKTIEELTNEEFAEMTRQIKYTNWGNLYDSLNLNMCIPTYAWDFEGIIYYRYWCKGQYILDLVYIDNNAEKVLEGGYPRVEDDGSFCEIIKVNEHLYVYLRKARME